MKLLIQNNRIIGTATDDYSGSEVSIDAPDDFNPALTSEYQFTNGVVVIPVITISKAISKIDADTDAVYGEVLGNRSEEYTSAMSDALAYKAASYTGTVPSGVSSLSAAKSWTATQATDDIINTATGWKTAQAAIRANRLATKEKIKNTTTPEDINKIMDSWNAFMSYIRSELSI